MCPCINRNARPNIINCFRPWLQAPCMRNAVALTKLDQTEEHTQTGTGKMVKTIDKIKVMSAWADAKVDLWIAQSKEN